MESEQYNITVEENSENSLKELLIRYVFHWKWFFLSILLSLVIARFYYKKQKPLYEINATVLIKDDSKGQLSELSAFEDLGLLKKNNDIDNEIEILKSRSLMMRVVNDLTLNVSYFIKERHVESELYKNSPIQLQFIGNDSSYRSKFASYYINFDSENSFILKNSFDEEIGKYRVGDLIKTDAGEFSITTSRNFGDWCTKKDLRVDINPLIVTADQYRSSIVVSPVNKSSSVLMLTLQDNVIDKACDILNNLIRQRNIDAIADKNQVSKNTANFINERIQFISNELNGVESEVEDFKTKNKLTDVESEAKLFLQTSSESEMNFLEINTQARIAEFMYDYVLKHNEQDNLVPSNIGLADASAGSQISEYNKLVLERNRILKSSSIKNPVVETLSNQIIGLRASLVESLKNYISTLKIKINELNKKENEINQKIGTVPKYEREFRKIQRQQQIKEQLYLYLLQKREETNIALAVTVANAKVVDYAYSNGEMISPHKNKIYLSAFLIGLVFPIIILIVLDLLDTKVHGKKETDAANIPYLGDIPNTENKAKLIVNQNDRSNIAEAFRLLRSNVDFLTSELKGKSKVIFVTSTVGKEGKSFIALNLAATFALSGKRSLLIGTDLRAPKILTYLKMDDRKGLTNYIAEEGMDLKQLIFKSPNIDFFDILPSGPIPPNPAELLMSSKVKDVFNFAESNYDYVIVDTAPVGLVADTLLISSYADATVFVARANYLDKRLLRIAESLNKQKRLPNMACLINDTDARKGYGYAYGYGYGYGYGGYGYGSHRKDRPLWKRLIFDWK